MTLQQSQSDQAAIRNTIRQVFNRIRAIVDRREQELIDRVDSIEANFQRSIQEHQDILQSLKEQLSDFSNTLQKMQPNTDPASILEQRDSLKSTIDNLNTKIDYCTVPRSTDELMGAQNFETHLVDILPLIYLKARPCEYNHPKSFISCCFFLYFHLLLKIAFNSSLRYYSADFS